MLVPQLEDFRFYHASHIPLEDIESLKECIEGYLSEYEENVEWFEIFKDIESKLKQIVIFTYYKDSICGFLVGSVSVNQYGKTFAFCDYLYVKRIAREDGISFKMCEMAIGLAKGMGAKEIFFSTKRNSKAFLRFLGKGWKKDSEVLKLCVQ